MSGPTVYDDPGRWTGDGRVNLSGASLDLPGLRPYHAPPNYGRLDWAAHGSPRIRTPNGQQITGLVAGRRLYVHTRSRIYYLRRNRLRLWRIL